MNRYSYKDLLLAVEQNGTQEDINALGEWFSEYGTQYWNGEYYNADGLNVWPIYSEPDEYGDCEILGYTLR